MFRSGRNWFMYFAVILVIAQSGPAGAQDAPKPSKPALPPAPDGVTIHQDVSFLAPERNERLDLYLPAGRPNEVRSPAVVMIHGGGWVGGDKSEHRSFNICTTLALKGYVCASINYTLDRESCWPTNLYDCKNAVRFLRANAEKYRIDVNNIGVIGGSAGGHLALMVAYTSDLPKLDPGSLYPGISDAVRCVVDLYGITNLLTRRKTDKEGNPTGELIAKSPLMPKNREEDPDSWMLASPAYHVSKSSRPTLIIHGKSDTTVDINQSIELHRKLEEHGVENRLIVLDAIGHTFDLQTWRRNPLPYDLSPIVVEFFDKHLRPKHQTRSQQQECRSGLSSSSSVFSKEE